MADAWAALTGWRQRHGRRVAWNSEVTRRRILRCYGQYFDDVADEFAMCFRMISNTAAAREARGVGPCEPACRRIDDSSELLFHEPAGARVQDVGSTDVRGQRRVVESVVRARIFDHCDVGASPAHSLAIRSPGPDGGPVFGLSAHNTHRD